MAFSDTSDAYSFGTALVASFLNTPDLRTFRIQCKFIIMAETAEIVVAIFLIAVLLLSPRFLSFRHRAIAGAIIFLSGWTIIFLGFVLSDQQFLQSQKVAFIWVGASAFAIMIGVTLLVPVAYEWWRKHRKPRRKKENWDAGHWKG